ncbi:hypothetical protein [Kitasatospora sp. NPDC093102]|uniref:hypothetical protein n=1 Tax=Kitasatospora sp. NPDC093102 TaxID=3155069 RepID=UPI00341E4590
MTYGQLSVLRSLETHGPDHRSVANPVSVREVPFGLGAAQVMDAWHQLVAAHESLRTTCDLSGPAPAQTVHPCRPSRVAAVEPADPTAFAKHDNFLGEVDAEPAAGSALHTGIEWRPSTQRSGPNFHLAVATGKGTLIGVGASRDYLEGNLPAVLAASIEAGLINISKGSESSLADVSLDNPWRIV